MKLTFESKVNLSQKTIGVIGILSVLTLASSLVIFGLLNSDFSFRDDFISELGAIGEPHALLFNLIGFVGVGILLSLFGYLYGKLLNDKLLSILLSLFGLGFAFTALPIDIEFTGAPLSKAHIVAICLALAFWLFGLSRLGQNQRFENRVRYRANISALLLILAMLGYVFGIWSMPITHRLVFMTVFGWTAITSIELIINNKMISH